MTKNIAVFAFVMLTLGSLAASHSPAFANWLIDSKGNLTHPTTVLGDQTATPEPAKTPEPVHTSDSVATPEPTEAQKKAQEDLKTQVELKQEIANKVFEHNREITKFHLEAVRENQLKVKEDIKDKAGKTIKEKETEVAGDEHLDVEQPDGKPLEIDAVKTGELEITKNNLKAHTDLPISVNANNELQMTRPDGTTQVLTVLPDQVVTKLENNGINVSSDKVSLTTNSTGDPIYVVEHPLSKKFLGLFSVQFGSQTTVSATDQSSVTTTTTETSALRRILEQLSF